MKRIIPWIPLVGLIIVLKYIDKDWVIKDEEGWLFYQSVSPLLLGFIIGMIALIMYYGI